MSHSGEAALQVNAYAWRMSEADSDLNKLCERIRAADVIEAKLLPAKVLSYMAKILNCVEIDIHVEECLPMVCEAAHLYVRAMGSFSSRHADHQEADAARERLIQSLEILADEVRLCRPLAVAS